MRLLLAENVEALRVLKGPYASPRHARFGAFHLRLCGRELTIIVSNGDEWPLPPPAWEHVSVSAERSCPTWSEMDAVKNIFWGPEETVVQFHPPRSEWVNNHPRCLHLWRPIGLELPRPPSITVGIKSQKNVDSVEP